jgi:pimeloyl-ACP methyl ester carboxylesterase
MPDMVEDLACIMRDAQVETVTCVGHDWGAQVCWEAARARPDLVEAVAGAVVPVSRPNCFSFRSNISPVQVFTFGRKFHTNQGYCKSAAAFKLSSLPFLFPFYFARMEP